MGTASLKTMAINYPSLLPHLLLFLSLGTSLPSYTCTQICSDPNLLAFENDNLPSSLFLGHKAKQMSDSMFFIACTCKC